MRYTTYTVNLRVRIEFQVFTGIFVYNAMTMWTKPPTIHSHNKAKVNLNTGVFSRNHLFRIICHVMALQ